MSSATGEDSPLQKGSVVGKDRAGRPKSWIQEGAVEAKVQTSELS